MPGRVIYLVRSWPRLSQTFILNEVLAQEHLGADLALVSLARSEEPLVQPLVHMVRADVTCLDQPRPREWLARLADHALVASSAPWAYAKTVLFAARSPHLAHGYATCSTLRCLSHAVRLAAVVQRGRRTGRPVKHLHAHFAHDPGLVALLTNRLTGVPYSITAHARDLYQIPVESLRARAGAATAVVTCCQANVDYLRAVLPKEDHGRLRLIRHGVELSRFVPTQRPARDERMEIVAVGRLIRKKGFPDLLRACHLMKGVLPPDCRFRLRVYGDGPLHDELVDLRDWLGLRDDVEFLGACDADEILRAYHQADIFALTPHVTADGDRDGVPNVIVEAMACGLPVVATAAGGVGEVVHHDVNGLLATPRDVDAVAGHLGALVGDASRRRKLGRAARRTVEDGYDVDAAARELADVFAASGAAR